MTTKRVKLLQCTCAHEYQDTSFGKGQRVHNKTEEKVGEGMAMYRCTVCGATRKGKA